MSIRYPSIEQVEKLYKEIVASGKGVYGYLSKSNLDYILETVKDVGEGLPRHQALIKKASFILYNIVAIHPFINGNKRTGYELARIFLGLNGYDFKPDAVAAYKTLLQIAEGKLSAKDVQKWIARNLTETKE